MTRRVVSFSMPLARSPTGAGGVGAVSYLAGLFLAIGLATSRLGLVLHELGGHGGAALALGGDITGAQLFWFAGGWIRYDFSDPTAGALLAVSLGGIAIELVIGAVLWFGIRGDRVGHRLVRGVGGALAIHAGWYLATGTWHGYGDGALVHRALGAWRYPVAIAAGLATCVVAFAVARLVLGALAARIPGAHRVRVIGVIVAAGLAAGVQAGLALGELAVRGDHTYGAIMTSERDRDIARELRAWQREQERAGAALDDAARAAERQRLAARHAPEPPFVPVLAALLGLAVALGWWRARAAPVDGPPARRHLAIAIALAAGSIVVVVTLGAAFS